MKPTQPQPNPYGAKPVTLPPPKENGTGIAGFIVSVIGIVTCGFASIFGVIISAIGLRKEPRGMAIAGLILGMIGLVELAGFGFLMFAGFRGAQQLGQVMQQSAVEIQLQSKANEIGQVWEHQDGRIPTQEEGDDLVDGSLDMWGNQIQYESDEFSFSLRSPGQDGDPNTEDDVVAGPFTDANAAQVPYSGNINWELDENMNEAEMEEVEASMEQLEEQLDKQLEEQLEKQQKLN